ncbi:MAG: radical SAM protein [Acidobacteriota bacterium]|nr:radical SAM protein [Acidobacteriota bacterium]
MTGLIPAHLDHRRSWAEFVYCYPVVSRRSKGVSLGVNLNPDKVCNFDCVYCEVDRTKPGRRRDIDLDQLESELSALLDLTLDGSLFTVPPFDSTRPEQRRLNDIAFSGDGEPTTAKEFAEAVERVAHLKWQRGLEDVKLVLITDSSRLQAREVVQGLDTLMANHGEIWAKLDAGTEAYYQEINRTSIPFARIVENIEITARLRPITIQSLFLSWKGQGPPKAEVAAYCDHLRRIQGMGGQLQGIQLYTVARPTPEPEARPLPAAELDALADQVRESLPTVPIEVFYGPEEPSW